MIRHRSPGAVLAAVVSVAMVLCTVCGPADRAAAARPASIERDPANRLGVSATTTMPRDGADGRVTENTPRCFSFRFPVPAEGIRTAVLHLKVRPSLRRDGMLSGADSLTMAVAANGATPGCDVHRGGMAGCVFLHQLFENDTVAVNIDLVRLGCDATLVDSGTGAQKAVVDQLATGEAHFMLEDDTALLGAELVINDGPDTVSCGNSNSPVNPATGEETGSSGVLRVVAGRAVVRAGETVVVPLSLQNPARVGVANLNVEVGYRTGVVVIEGDLLNGPLFAGALRQTNAAKEGRVLVGIAHRPGSTESGSNSVVSVRFRAIGRVGDRTPLNVKVVIMNAADGTRLDAQEVAGEIEIVGPDGGRAGDCDGDGVLREVDALCALQVSVQLLDATPALRSALDLDGDGSLTSRDAALILQRATGTA